MKRFIIFSGLLFLTGSLLFVCIGSLHPNVPISIWIYICMFGVSLFGGACDYYLLKVNHVSKKNKEAALSADNAMSLQEALRKLSWNKGVAVKTLCHNGKCLITIEEEYNYNELMKVEYVLDKPAKEQPEIFEKLKQYFK